eukprot:jgi/Chrzof1/14870/Cz09g19010.t1
MLQASIPRTESASSSAPHEPAHSSLSSSGPGAVITSGQAQQQATATATVVASSQPTTTTTTSSSSSSSSSQHTTTTSNSTTPSREPAGTSAAGASGGWDTQQLAADLREYERARSSRCLPITIRSYAFGFALQIPYRPVTAIRDLFIEKAFSPAHFLDHTLCDCGTLD